ncbi:MAG: alpha/beta hydrolase-fold protein [Crocinitomicaceae bacterium]|nr:alpha/beta hydrolase-fold protein [Crocinitomicaceae bacterium]
MRQLILFLFISANSFGQLPSNNQGATVIPFESEVLGYQYDLWVSLPDDYDSTKNYPVLYLLDAEWRFDITRALVRELAVNDRCPQHIIVGVPQIDRPHRLMNLTFTDSKITAFNEPDTINPMVTEESSGGGDEFLRFLETEVIPFANKKYSTNGFNVLMGHSLSGYFAAYAMLKSDEFQAFQIYDPSIWYNASDVLNQLRAHLPKDIKATAFVGHAQGGMDLDVYFITAIDSLRLLFDEYDGIRSASKFYTEEYHNSMYMFGVIDGMSFLYDGYDYGYIAPTDTVTVADYIAHFEDFSKKVNFTFDPSRVGFLWVGYANYSQGNWEEALKAYSYLGNDYDNDSFYLAQAASCYEHLGRTEEALAIYKRALVIEPDNDEIKAKIKLLKKKR